VLLGTTPVEEQHHGKLTENLRNIIENLWEHDGNTRKHFIIYIYIYIYHHTLATKGRKDEPSWIKCMLGSSHCLHIYMHILSLDMIATIYLFIYLFLPRANTPSTKHTIPMDDNDDDDESIPSCPSSKLY
jgi:hypothetical protein